VSGAVAVSRRATNEVLRVMIGRVEGCGARERARERERNVVGGALEISEKDVSVRGCRWYGEDAGKRGPGGLYVIRASSVGEGEVGKRDNRRRVLVFTSLGNSDSNMFL
jgi:hypothetical protein